MMLSKEKIQQDINAIINTHLPTLCPIAASEKISSALSEIIPGHLPTFFAALDNTGNSKTIVSSSMKPTRTMQRIVAAHKDICLVEQVAIDAKGLALYNRKSWAIKTAGGRELSPDLKNVVFSSLIEAHAKFHQVAA